MKTLCTLFLLLLAGAALAQAADRPPVEQVVVTATRVSALASRVSATVTVIERSALDERLPADEADLFRDEPDLALARDLRRFGATRPNIRGIEDNRVVQLVDGVRLPAFFDGSGPANFTMSAPLGTSLEFLRRAEVVRGPGSSLYGSDAIGGVIGYLTLEPGDVVRPGGRTGAIARLGHSGANEGVTGSLFAAGRGMAAEWLLGYANTAAHEFDNQGDVDTVSTSRTRPNPQDVRDRGVLAKLRLRPGEGHRLTLGAETRERDAHSELLRLSASLPKVTYAAGDDRARRVRGSVEWEHRQPGGPWYERLAVRLHRQESESHNFNRQERPNTSATCSGTTGSGNVCRIEQDFFFEQRASGVTVEAEGGALAYGIDAMRVSTEELRDARVYNLTRGTFSKTLIGDVHPVRDFAPGTTDTLGLFVQGEWRLPAADRLALQPGLRYDRQRLRPEVDALAQAVLTANGKEAVSRTESRFSPKLGALWQIAPQLAAFGQVVRGFRAPNYQEVNGVFRNSVQSNGISPNPALRPEVSTSVEAGLRLARDGLRGQFSLYDNRYRDFIASTRLDCPADPNCIAGLAATFMSVNLSRARIYGGEARLSWDFAPRWRLDGAAAYAHGSDEQSGRPLDTVEPTRLALALSRDTGDSGAQLRLRVASAVKRVNDYSGTVYSPWFRPPGYAVLDVAAWWQPAKGLRLALAVNNLLDRKYWLWSDIRQADARDPAGVDFYSQPGRNLAARLEYTF